jgi:hypothetical protein
MVADLMVYFQVVAENKETPHAVCETVLACWAWLACESRHIIQESKLKSWCDYFLTLVSHEELAVRVASGECLVSLSKICSDDYVSYL